MKEALSFLREVIENKSSEERSKEIRVETKIETIPVKITEELSKHLKA